MASQIKALLDQSTRIKVSSTLDKSVGKKCLIDGSPETCWTSQQGLPQFIHITFSDPVIPKTLQMTFQGGFVGKRCRLSTLPATSADEKGVPLAEFTTVYPEDVNRKQIFKLPETEPIVQMKLSIEESSDFFGRITVYDLQIEGLLNPNNSA